MPGSTWTRLAIASAAVIGLATAGLAAAPTASAQEPTGQCPPGFALQEAIGGRFVAMDHNGDRLVCTMTVPAPPNRVVSVIVDDAIPIGVHLP